jgi:NAD(P)-dependent dehydrogenase (short-subunit alcohol dehydrogenase family)
MNRQTRVEGRMLKDKVALITGGSSGLGKAAAVLLANEGCKVGILGRTPGKVLEVVKEIADSGGEVIPIVADITDKVEVQGAVKQVIDRWGRLDILFANAGINGVWAPIEDLSYEEWNNTINVNLTGTFLTVKYAVPHLKGNGGSVIITSSINGTRTFSNTGATAYSCSKAAQVAMTKMLALELAKHKIRVNVICPGKIESEIHDNTIDLNTEREKEPVEFPEGEIPLTRGEPGKAEEVGKLVLFLASDNSAHITGTEIYIDGAQSLLIG